MNGFDEINNLQNSLQKAYAFKHRMNAKIEILWYNELVQDKHTKSYKAENAGRYLNHKIQGNYRENKKIPIMAWTEPSLNARSLIL